MNAKITNMRGWAGATRLSESKRYTMIGNGIDRLLGPYLLWAAIWGLIYANHSLNEPAGYYILHGFVCVCVF